MCKKGFALLYTMIVLVLLNVNVSFADEGWYKLFETVLKGNWNLVSPGTGNYYENLGSLKIISINHENGRMLGQLDTARTGKVNIYGCLSEGGGIITFSRSGFSCTSADKTSDKIINLKLEGL